MRHDDATFRVLAHSDREIKINRSFGDGRETADMLWASDRHLVVAPARRGDSFAGNKRRSGELLSVAIETGMVRRIGWGARCCMRCRTIQTRSAVERGPMPRSMQDQAPPASLKRTVQREGVETHCPGNHAHADTRRHRIRRGKRRQPLLRRCPGAAFLRRRRGDAGPQGGGQGADRTAGPAPARSMPGSSKFRCPMRREQGRLTTACEQCISLDVHGLSNTPLRHRAGFTLVEVLIALAVAALAAAGVFFGYQQALYRIKINKAVQDVQMIAARATALDAAASVEDLVDSLRSDGFDCSGLRCSSPFDQDYVIMKNRRTPGTVRPGRFLIILNVSDSIAKNLGAVLNELSGISITFPRVGNMIVIFLEAT